MCWSTSSTPIAVLQRAAGLLEEDGVLLVHVPNANATNRRLAVLMGTLTECEELSPFDIEIAGHRRSYSLTTLTQDIENAGLQVTKTGGVFYNRCPQPKWIGSSRTASGKRGDLAGVALAEIRKTGKSSSAGHHTNWARSSPRTATSSMRA